MLNRFFAMCLLTGLTAACAAKPINKPIDVGPVGSGPGSTTAARKFLEGRWSLESFEVFPPGKPPVVMKGSGVLTYDDFSNLKIEIRTDDKTADLLDQAGIINQGGMISSSGRTAVDMQNHTLTYILEGQPAGFVATGPLATNKPRYWVVEGNVLTLTTKDADGKPLSVARWKKQS
jgi:hypothetical protein